MTSLLQASTRALKYESFGWSALKSLALNLGQHRQERRKTLTTLIWPMYNAD
jgi:hypothetical protein